LPLAQFARLSGFVGQFLLQEPGQGLGVGAANVFIFAQMAGIEPSPKSQGGYQQRTGDPDGGA